MKHWHISTIAVVILVAQTSLAAAATVRLTQQWEAEGFATNGFHLTTTALFSDAGLSGVGTERALLDYLGAARYSNGIAQNFSVADFTDPPSFNLEGNSFAQYQNGIFQGLGNVSLGGAARVALRNGTLAGGISGGYNVGSSEFIYHFPVSGRRRYLLQSSELIVSTVPLPGAIVLLATGLLGLGATRRTCAATRRAALPDQPHASCAGY